jgi:hypothetical protein
MEDAHGEPELLQEPGRCDGRSARGGVRAGECGTRQEMWNVWWTSADCEIDEMCEGDVYAGKQSEV